MEALAVRYHFPGFLSLSFSLTFLLIQNFAFALVLTTSIEVPPSKENSSYGNASSIIRRHGEDKGGCALFICAYGLGAIPLGYTLAVEGTNTTRYGREYNRAKKLKSFIIATSNHYVDGKELLLQGKKSASDRKKIYKKSTKMFEKLYAKLSAEYAYNKQPTRETVKDLLWRANKLGLLTCKSLLKQMIKEDSFDSIVWLIHTGQLLDRTLKIEAILKEQYEDLNKIQNRASSDETLKSIFDTVPFALIDKELIKAVYDKTRDNIKALPDFEYDNGDDSEDDSQPLDFNYEPLIGEI